MPSPSPSTLLGVRHWWYLHPSHHPPLELWSAQQGREKEEEDEGEAGGRGEAMEEAEDIGEDEPPAPLVRRRRAQPSNDEDELSPSMEDEDEEVKERVNKLVLDLSLVCVSILIIPFRLVSRFSNSRGHPCPTRIVSQLRVPLSIPPRSFQHKRRS